MSDRSRSCGCGYCRECRVQSAGLESEGCFRSGDGLMGLGESWDYLWGRPGLTLKVGLFREEDDVVSG